ncbi:MAG: 2TM domain-containing protein [Alphaproteobacteria bacterium]|nr:2TM domain-containing protein [Alphaproteobacteria bacterium]
MTKENDVRKQVKLLKRFYMDSFTFAVVNVALIVVWLSIDRGVTFWPKYVIVIWGIALVFKAYRMGIIPLFLQNLSFLTPEWEEKKIKKLTGVHQEQRRVQLSRDKKK